MDHEIIHISEHNYAYPIDKDILNVRLKVRKDYYEQINVLYKNLYNHDNEIFKKQMTLLLRDEIYEIYECHIQVKERHFKYYFELIKDNKKIAYTADGLIKEPKQDNFFYYPVINDDEIIALPEWAKGEIIYQILVDRFYDGCINNNPRQVKNVNQMPDRNTYYGGDFHGIIKKLDYIKSLGTKIIYLSPVFSSPTYHKYDIKDYYKIEDIYGGEEGLTTLINEAHKLDIKIILDCVYNHCSIENDLFQDVIKNGVKSNYKDWFIIDNFPINTKKCNYDTFGGLVPSMPRFNTSNKAVIEYLVGNAVYWTKKLNVDGFRLDVADEVSIRLWREFRARLKEIKPDILIIGEVWNHASKWLQGDQFDTVTNYKFRKWLLDFLTEKITSREFWNKINANKMLYKTPFHTYLINLVGSHDTIRLKTFLKNDKIHYLALALMLTLDGMPLIYYGDEIGLEGDVDPDNRRPFKWDEIDKEELKMIKELGQLRSAYQPLKKGDIIPIIFDDRVLAFIRRYRTEEIIVVINFTNQNKKLKLNVKRIIYGSAEILDNAISISKLSIVLFK